MITFEEFKTLVRKLRIAKREERDAKSVLVCSTGAGVFAEYIMGATSVRARLGDAELERWTVRMTVRDLFALASATDARAFERACVLPAWLDRRGVDVDSGAFAEALKSVSYALLTDDFAYQMGELSWKGYVHISSQAASKTEQLSIGTCFEASDGHRLVRSTLAKSKLPPIDTSIPYNAVEAILWLMARAMDGACVSANGEQHCISAAGVVISWKPCGDAVPDFDQTFARCDQGEKARRVEHSAKELSQTLRGARYVDFEFTPKQLSVFGIAHATDGVGFVRMAHPLVIPRVLSATDMRAGHVVARFDANYVIETLKSAGKLLIELSFGGKDDPMIARVAGEGMTIKVALMPVRQ